MQEVAEEAGTEDVKRCAGMVGIFPGEPSIMRLIGAVLLGQNGEWRTDRCCIALKAIRPGADPEPLSLPALAG